MVKSGPRAGTRHQGASVRVYKLRRESPAQIRSSLHACVRVCVRACVLVDAHVHVEAEDNLGCLPQAAS